MSVNVKLGNDTINNVDSVRLRSADVEGEYYAFGSGGGGNVYQHSIYCVHNNSGSILEIYGSIYTGSATPFDIDTFLSYCESTGAHKNENEVFYGINGRYTDNSVKYAFGGLTWYIPDGTVYYLTTKGDYTFRTSNVTAFVDTVTSL